MAQSESGLTPLLGELHALAPGDRAAVLARLTPDERERMRMLLRGAAGSARPASPYSPDIAERIARPETVPTDAARTALAALLAEARAAGEAEGTAAPSLVDHLFARVRAWRTS